MEILLTDVDWLAVVVGAVVAFILGWAWYSPKLFGTKWAEGSKVNMKAAGEMSMLPMVAQGAATFLLAWAIGVTEALGAFPLAILFGLAASGLIKANGLFAQKNNYAVMTETGFVLAMVAVMILTHLVI